ncbi:aspartate racemase/maleate isomerase family protein [Halomonas sp. WWR20]
MLSATHDNCYYEKSAVSLRLPRLGIIVVHNDPTPEMELWNLANSGASIHTVRFYLPREKGKIFTGSSFQTIFEECGLKRALLDLRDIRVDAICLCFTSASIFMGSSFDDDFIKYASEITGVKHINTSVRAMLEVLEARELTSPAMLVPPWYSSETVKAFTEFLAAYNISVSSKINYKMPQCWSSYPQQDIFDEGGAWEITPLSIIELVKSHAKEGTNFDSILMPGSGFPSLSVTRTLESSLNRPFLSANETTWKWFMRASSPE